MPLHLGDQSPRGLVQGNYLVFEGVLRLPSCRSLDVNTARRSWDSLVPLAVVRLAVLDVINSSLAAGGLFLPIPAARTHHPHGYFDPISMGRLMTCLSIWVIKDREAWFKVIISCSRGCSDLITVGMIGSD